MIKMKTKIAFAFLIVAVVFSIGLAMAVNLDISIDKPNPTSGAVCETNGYGTCKPSCDPNNELRWYPDAVKNIDGDDAYPCPKKQVCCVAVADATNVNKYCSAKHPGWECLNPTTECAEGAGKIESNLCPGFTELKCCEPKEGTEKQGEKADETPKGTPQESKYKCFKLQMNWTVPSKSNFTVDWNYWKSHPFECAYSSLVRVYSFIEAISYVRGSGTCSSEQPLSGAEYCESCNLPYTSCTPERCKILGTSCRAIPTENADQVMCIKGICEPTLVPVITNMDVRFYIDRTKSWRNFTEINPPCPFAPTNISKSATCIKLDNKVPHNVSDIEINIDLNQKAKCRYIVDKFNASFEEMTDFDDNKYYPESQSVTIDVTDLELGQNHTVYIKCEGACGQSHDPGFDWNYVRFEFQDKPDDLPPVIVKVVPDPTKQYISNESTEETIEIWLDEAGYCKYSHMGESEACGNNLTTNWTGGAEGMCAENQAAWNVNSFTCNRNNEQCCSAPGITGESTCYNKTDCGRCYLNIDPRSNYEEINWSQLEEGAELPELADEIPKETLDYMKSIGMTGIGKVFTYMFRCSDTAGNIMNEDDSYLYVIMTYPPFEMNLTKPENNSETYEREVEMEVNTSRATECRYFASNKSFDWPDWDEMTAVDDGFVTEHAGKTSELYVGASATNYILYVRCRDAGGLEQKDFVRFRVLRDTDPPKVIRFYKWEDYLYVETDELSDCVYGTDSCKYNFTDGSAMVGDMQYIHSAPWSLDDLYYMKCQDRWNNTPSSTECTAVISPYEVPSI